MVTLIRENFLGLKTLPAGCGKGAVVVVSVPFENSTTYQTGTANGPSAILNASTNVELYDEELDWVPARAGIETGRVLEGFKSAEDMISAVRMETAYLMKRGQFPVILGGEHTVAVGGALGAMEACPGISVLQFDAHADLREKYLGSPYNHACVMARIREQMPAVQVGIRSLSSPEAERIKSRNYPVIWAGELASCRDKSAMTAIIDKIIDNLTEKVYITLDVDVLDPSLMPSTGTPEPGGMDWYQLLYVLKTVCERRKVMGMDVTELRPIPGNGAPDFTVARLIYKVLGYRFSKDREKFSNYQVDEEDT